MIDSFVHGSPSSGPTCLARSPAGAGERTVRGINGGSGLQPPVRRTCSSPRRGRTHDLTQ